MSDPIPSHRPLHLLAGEATEQAACAFLERQGLRIVARNLRSRGGELDIVAWHGNILVFVEVRWRASQRHGGALASIGWRKQQRLRRAIAGYLQRLEAVPPCRLDALCLDGGQSIGWQWIQGI